MATRRHFIISGVGTVVAVTELPAKAFAAAFSTGLTSKQVTTITSVAQTLAQPLVGSAFEDTAASAASSLREQYGSWPANYQAYVSQIADETLRAVPSLSNPGSTSLSALDEASRPAADASLAARSQAGSVGLFTDLISASVQQAAVTAPTVQTKERVLNAALSAS